MGYATVKTWRSLEVYWRFHGDYVTITSLEEFLVPLKAETGKRGTHMAATTPGGASGPANLLLGLPWGATSAAINEEETGSNRMIYNTIS